MRKGERKRKTKLSFLNEIKEKKKKI